MQLSRHQYCHRILHLKTFDRYPGVFLLLDGAHARWAFVTAGGLQILGLCDGTRSVADVTKALVETRGMSDAEAQQQVAQFLEAMVETGLVYDSREQPVEIARPQTRFSGLTIEITKRCNLRCRHCYLAAGEPNPAELTGAEIKDLISQARDLGATFTNLSGGEPLLHPDCFALLEHIGALGLQSIIGTNATLVTAEVARRLADLPMIVQVSLDGTSSETHDAVRGPGAFRRTMQGLDNLQQAGMAGRVSLAFTAMAGNVQDAATIIELALAKGLAGPRFYLSAGRRQCPRQLGRSQAIGLTSLRVLGSDFGCSPRSGRAITDLAPGRLHEFGRSGSFEGPLLDWHESAGRLGGQRFPLPVFRQWIGLPVGQHPAAGLGTTRAGIAPRRNQDGSL